jgi:hypothetical protein
MATLEKFRVEGFDHAIKGFEMMNLRFFAPDCNKDDFR